MSTLRQTADQIISASIQAVLPDEAVRRALKDFHPEGRVFLVAAGKAAWQMAHAAVSALGAVEDGVVVTKKSCRTSQDSFLPAVQISWR